ncbi:hypothetical protein JOB18_035341 [Solea senegalensis]|uniref:Arginine vasopressin-induced protein 1 n=2 Tax=Solea senegalensis TaxID=28829 RepID=A0AAV6QB96_SOLSE|nr:hypothetical protein JOB18_035341 [Solea senegalensis]
MWVSLALGGSAFLRITLLPLLSSPCSSSPRGRSSQCNMAEAQAFIEEALPVQWKIFHRRSRKTGCSNIFTGVNFHQLQRLYRAAGDRDAKHRAKRVWREGAEERTDKEGEEREDEARLAQALVGLRVRARNKAGIRVEGHRDHKWLRASGCVKTEEPLSDYTVEDEETAPVPSQGEFLLPAPAEEDITENQTPLKPSSWRAGVARQDSTSHSEHSLHRILH